MKIANERAPEECEVGSSSLESERGVYHREECVK
jgi:hypothetical protein